MKLVFDRNFGKWFLNDVLRAIKRYRMIGPDEGVGVALSGGKDSTLLLFLLRYLQRFSHLRFRLFGLHVRAFPDDDPSPLAEYCRSLGVPYLETALDWEPNSPNSEVDGNPLRTGPAGDQPLADHPGKTLCSVCARLKRGAMARLCAEHGLTRLAYGHHATDAAETLLMNLLENRKLGSFSPRIDLGGPLPRAGVTVPGTPGGPLPGAEAPANLAGGRVQVVRPMIYLDERTVTAVHRHLGLSVTSFRCRFATVNRRAAYKAFLAGLEKTLAVPRAPRRIVDALENLDHANLWEHLWDSPSPERESR